METAPTDALYLPLAPESGGAWSGIALAPESGGVGADLTASAKDLSMLLKTETRAGF